MPKKKAARKIKKQPAAKRALKKRRKILVEDA